MTESTCFHVAKKMYCKNNSGWGNTCSRLKTENGIRNLPAGRQVRKFYENTKVRMIQLNFNRRVV